MSALSCAKCCSVLSLSGIVFLSIIGSLLQNQPLYIKGIEDPEAAASGCFSGAGLYFGTMVISLGYWYYSEKSKSSLQIPNQRGVAYGSVPNPIHQ